MILMKASPGRCPTLPLSKNPSEGGGLMRFYNEQHEFYVGIDLHARQMFVCVMDRGGTVLLHRNMPADPTHLDRVVTRFAGDLVIAVECIFTWYWIADFCDERQIPFVLGHDAPGRDAASGLRLSSKDACNPRPTRITAAANRVGIQDRFEDISARKSIEADLHLLDVYHRVLLDLEAQIKRQAVHHDPVAYHLLKSIPGVGPILALVILYEIGDIRRFPKVGNFISYARLVKCAHESAGAG
jgi:hypothetical protein